MKDKIEFKNIKIEDLKTISKKVLEIVEDFFSKNKRSLIIFLNGDLGSGKTTFVKIFGHLIKEKENIISPTFVIRKDYEKFIHIDGYRFEKEEEGKCLNLEEELNSQKIIFIEWPYKFVKACDIKSDIEIDFEYLGEEERNVIIKIQESF